MRRAASSADHALGAQLGDLRPLGLQVGIDRRIDQTLVGEGHPWPASPHRKSSFLSASNVLPIRRKMHRPYRRAGFHEVAGSRRSFPGKINHRVPRWPRPRTEDRSLLSAWSVSWSNRSCWAGRLVISLAAPGHFPHPRAVCQSGFAPESVCAGDLLLQILDLRCGCALAKSCTARD